MANITRIKAKDPNKSQEKEKTKSKNEPEVAPKTKAPKDGSKDKKRAEKQAKKAGKKPFLLFRPFVALGRYLKNSWIELRQVRWPSRKATWKMVLAVFIYTIIFGGFLLLLDVIFDLIFSNLIG